MTLKPKTIADVENTYDFLLGVVSLAKAGDTHEIENGAFDYSRMILKAAEQPLRALNMFDVTMSTINEAERFIDVEDYKGAYNVLQSGSCKLMEKSGTAEKIRQPFDS
ncbi:hypothetical protein [Methylophilus luteus]|uniref:Uncharacterized protein n=1 Tax=Methylophilus luteus TaxID=640108 RepID=A0ABW3F607_9PROT